MLGIRFHTPAMPTSSAERGAFDYCVSDVVFITE
jgi:hypothetical protein